MKLRLRRHETRETLKLELADSSTLHDLRQRINASSPSSVHLSLNRKDELLAPSPEDTLRSLGVTSGDLIYYSLDHSAFVASVQENESASSGEAHQSLVPSVESSEGKSDESATLGPQSERNHDSMGIGFTEVVSDVDMNIEDQSIVNLNSGVEDSAEGSTGPDPMDVELDLELDAAGNKRLSVPFFLKKILLEKSGDTSELTTLALSIHAVMLESGFVLLNHGSDKFSLSKELLSTSLKYTLPELITRKDTTTIDSVTVRFQSLGRMVVVYGILGGSSRMIRLDKQRFVPVIDLVMDTLKFEKQSSCSEYRELFTFWRMVKDGLVMPLLIGLCDESGLELPLCLMRLPTELKLKILESLPASSVAKMCCVCTEMRYVASENDLWKLKCLKEAEHLVVAGGGSSGDSVNWKAKFTAFRMQQAKDAALRMERLRQLSRDRQNFQNLHMRGSRSRYPAIFQDDPPFNFLGDRSIGIPRGPPARGLGGGGRGRFRCILGGLD